jgi:pimeloyl-ACP methyl ester carboxylesterase
LGLALDSAVGPAPGEIDPRAPLAHLGGRAVPGPAWFKRAVACAPERAFLERPGGRVETIAWGEVGRPGLLLMHGNISTADVWRFIAPFFSASHRVAAFSWSGLGKSDWRPAYSTADYTDEAIAVARTLGLFDSATQPIFVAHSAGAGPALAAAHRLGASVAGLILADGRVRPVLLSDTPFPIRAHRLYPSFDDALAHFRFAPVQPCENLYIVDLIARAAIVEVDGGWTWRFDPKLYRNFPKEEVWELLPEIACPVALVNAETSQVTGDDMVPRLLERLAPGTTNVVLPETRHHLMVDQPLAFISVLKAFISQWHKTTVAACEA